jgi:2-methylaconitate cis-trans-isomerase PrpF
MYSSQRQVRKGERPVEDVKAVPCTIMRGGTSKAVFFLENDVPEKIEARQKFILAAFGSPDKRQIDGLGGADPLTSKCAVIGPATVNGADINYSFYQVGINSATVEPGLCGNISSAVAAFAIDKGLVRAVEPITPVKIYNTYLKRIITVEQKTRQGKPVYEGDYQIDGVPGSGAKVTLDLKNAAGGATGSLLPTGHVQDKVKIDGIGEIALSIVDFASPYAFIKASDIGLKGTELPSEVDSNPELLERLETIRGTAAEMAGMIPDRKRSRELSASNPILMFISPAVDYFTFTGNKINGKDISFVSRAMFMQIMHKTYPGAAAFCTGVAAKMEGTVVNEFMTKTSLEKKSVIIGHPGGTMEVEAEVEKAGNGFEINSARLSRTARKIMDGYVYIRTSLL